MAGKGCLNPLVNSALLIKPKKPRGRVWPGLTSVGGDIQPQVVTVLTPATQRRWQNFSLNLKFVNAKKLAKSLR